LSAGLIDKLRLLIMPVLAGRGELLLTEIGRRSLALTQSTILPSGVVILVYRIAQDLGIRALFDLFFVNATTANNL
jgi:dihydrofolate reductase